MRNVDPKWPVFILAGLLVGEKYYAQTLVPRVRKFKACHNLAKEVVLHSRHIRRQDEDFAFLSDPERRSCFYHDLNSLIADLRMRIYAVTIDKERLSRRFLIEMNPYDVSLNQLLSMVCGPPGAPSLYRPHVVRIIAESRGKAEDKQLQAEYQRSRKHGLASYGAPKVASRQPATVRKSFPRRVDFAKKTKAIAGLELVDLVAYPIGRAVVNDSWENPAVRVVAKKLRGFLPFP